MAINLSFMHRQQGSMMLLAAAFMLISHQIQLSAAPPGCNDWHQFRGSARNGTMGFAEDQYHWIEPSPMLLWSKEIGPGFSEVVSVGDHVYLMMAEKTDSVSGWEYLVCMESGTGTEIWRTRIDSIFIDVDEWGDGPRSTPAVDEETVFCFSASGKLAALDRYDGQFLWTVDFVSEFGSTVPRWGYSCSPLLLHDMVIMEVGGINHHGFAAFNKKSGAITWQNGSVNASYNSAIAAEINGTTQIIFANGSHLFSYDTNGDSLWSYTMPLRSPMALPLYIQPNRVLISAANDAGSFILEINDNKPEPVMESSRLRNDWSSSCFKDGYVYGFNVATLICMDVVSGERMWFKRGFGKGSLLMINNKLVVLSDQGGLTILEANPEAYTEIAAIDALQGRSWTAPSYANGKLFVRNHTHMACFQMIQPEKKQDQKSPAPSDS